MGFQFSIIVLSKFQIIKYFNPHETSLSRKHLWINFVITEENIFSHLATNLIIVNKQQYVIKHLQTILRQFCFDRIIM